MSDFINNGDDDTDVDIKKRRGNIDINKTL